MDDFDDINTLYEQALDATLGVERYETNRVRDTIYSGEIGFALQMHCIKPDVPPTHAHPDDTYMHYYKFTLIGLDHDTTMLILTSLRDVFPAPDTSSTLCASKRNDARKELEALGIPHMGQWLTCCRDKTYKICIRHLTYSVCSKICKVLFTW